MSSELDPLMFSERSTTTKTTIKKNSSSAYDENDNRSSSSSSSSSILHRYISNGAILVAIVMCVAVFGVIAVLQLTSSSSSSSGPFSFSSFSFNKLEVSILGGHHHHHHSKDNDRSKHVKSMVNVSKRKGTYSVNYDHYRSKHDDDAMKKIHPKTTTFAELAEIMVLPWYEASLMAVTTDKAWKHGISPTNCHQVRRSLLMARDMLDVFGPVFPGPTKHEKKDDSTWRKLRLQYRHGYQTIGQLQDLRGLKYSKKELEKRVHAVHEWKKKFIEFQKKEDIHHFLYSKHIKKEGHHGGGFDPKGCYDHKSSHLFWADTKKVPCGDDNGTKAVQSVCAVQLQHSLEYLKKVRNYKTVIPKSHQEEYHNLRKELRVFRDETRLFEHVLAPTKKEKKELKKHLRTLNQAQKILGSINDQWTKNEHHQKKSLEKKIDKKWKEFLKWEKHHKLEKVITDMLQHMKEF
mmetsp:Transcript_34109/g.38860  ORF Transcript_34109/g.38860 Transcript_34109/m.38860 type:complete len:461 (+) Transcript_34109:228-1610(+)